MSCLGFPAEQATTSANVSILMHYERAERTVLASGSARSRSWKMLVHQPPSPDKF